MTSVLLFCPDNKKRQYDPYGKSYCLSIISMCIDVIDAISVHEVTL